MLPLSKSLHALHSVTIDIVLEIPKNEETQKSYLLSSVHCSIKYDLLVTAKNNRFRNGDTTELNNTFIGISSENRAQEHLLDSFAKKHNLHIIKVHYPDQSRMLLDAESGFIDLFMTNTMNSFSKEKLIYNFGSYPTYIAFNKNNPQLKSQFDFAYAKIKTPNAFSYNSMPDTPPLQIENLTEKEKEFIAKNSPVTVYLRDVESITDNTNPFLAMHYKFFNCITDISGLEFRFTTDSRIKIGKSMYISSSSNQLPVSGGITEQTVPYRFIRLIMLFGKDIHLNDFLKTNINTRNSKKPQPRLAISKDIEDCV